MPKMEFIFFDSSFHDIRYTTYDSLFRIFDTADLAEERDLDFAGIGHFVLDLGGDVPRDFDGALVIHIVGGVPVSDSGAMLAGVRRFPGGLVTQSIVMRSKTGTVRLVETEHYFEKKAAIAPEFAR